jgi:hypothetical protein
MVPRPTRPKPSARIPSDHQNPRYQQYLRLLVPQNWMYHVFSASYTWPRGSTSAGRYPRSTERFHTGILLTLSEPRTFQMHTDDSSHFRMGTSDTTGELMKLRGVLTDMSEARKRRGMSRAIIYAMLISFASGLLVGQLLGAQTAPVPQHLSLELLQDAAM